MQLYSYSKTQPPNAKQVDTLISNIVHFLGFKRISFFPGKSDSLVNWFIIGESCTNIGPPANGITRVRGQGSDRLEVNVLVLLGVRGQCYGGAVNLGCNNSSCHTGRKLSEVSV